MESDEAQHVRERNARYAEVMSAGDRKPPTALWFRAASFWDIEYHCIPRVWE